MKRSILTMLVAAALLASTPAPAQVDGQMLFDQGCAAFDLVEDLGSTPTAVGQRGRWLVRSLEDGSERVYAFETIDLVLPPSGDPTIFGGTTYVAWRLEGTGIRGTNRSDFELRLVDANFNFTSFFQGITFRGNRYLDGGISGTAHGNFATGEFVYDAVRIVLCRKTPSGKDDD